MDNYLIWLMHIPKTGGTSLFRTLCKGVDAACVPDWTDQDIQQRAERGEQFCITPYQVMRAHYNFSLGDLLIGKPVRKVTVLRHPADRVVSMYNHFRINGNAEQRAAVKGKTLLEFCDMESWSQPGNNLMTRMLARGDCDIDAATRNLQTFDVFGALERWDALIARLEWAFMRPYPRTVAVNLTPKLNYYYPTAHERREILARNKMDEELWDYAMA